MNSQNEATGFYGEFGGTFVPEMLHSNIKELQLNYKKIIKKTSFKKTFYQLLKSYVGRPTPLLFCKKLSKFYKTKILT